MAWAPRTRSIRSIGAAGLIAPPCQVLVGSHEHEPVVIKCCRVGDIDVEDDEWDAAPRGRFDDA